MSYARNIQIPDEPPISIIGLMDAPGIGGFQLTDVARLSLPNVFLRENTFPAIRITPRLVTDSYVITHTDGEIVADASGHNIILTLPVSNGAGQNVRIKRIDSSSNSVNIVTQEDDVIDNGLTDLQLDPFQAATLVGAASNFWELGLFIPPFTLPSNIALRDADNFFTGVNSFTSIRLARKTISSDYTVLPTDFAIYIQGLTTDIDIDLPPALVADGRGQPLRFKKLDDNAFIVRINAQVGDLIDGAASVNLIDLYAEAQLFEGGVGYWDNTGTLPEMIQPIDPLPAAPTNSNEIVALLQAYGMCA